MYIPEKKLIVKVEAAFKKYIPFLTGLEIKRENKMNGGQIDLLVSGRLKSEAYHFCIKVKTAGYPQHVRDAAVILKKFTVTNPAYYPVMVVPFISVQGKKICDEHRVGYMDLSGNAKIAYKNIFIYTEGKDCPKEPISANTTVFSPKAARITKVILSNPCAEWIQKEIAEETALSKGLVSRIINKMIEMGYVTKKDKKLTLVNFDDLFSAWAESEIRKREKKRNYYIWAQNPQKMMLAVTAGLSRNKLKHAFTQEAAASLTAPFSTFDIVSVYIESLDDFPERDLSASKVDKGFNLTVIEAPDEHIFVNARDIKGFKIVDNLQLYADLKKNPLRGEKQAEHILALIKKRLK